MNESDNPIVWLADSQAECWVFSLFLACVIGSHVFEAINDRRGGRVFVCVCACVSVHAQVRLCLHVGV